MTCFAMFRLSSFQKGCPEVPEKRRQAGAKRFLGRLEARQVIPKGAKGKGLKGKGLRKGAKAKGKGRSAELRGGSGFRELRGVDSSALR